MVADNQQHYLVDDITVRTPCELLYQQRKKIKVVAHGIAEVPAQGGTIHGAPIPEGYARVMVDRVEKGWKTSTSRSLEAMEKRNYNMPSTPGSVGTSAT
jgi:hypothetical protein